MMKQKRRQRRRGSLYIAVMGVGLIVSVIALTASSIARIESRSARAAHDQREAQLLAASAIEQALAWMNHHTDWRQTLTSGVEAAPAVLGGGEFTWSVTDEDGNLNDDARDHAILRGVGRVGGAIAVEEAKIEPAGRALTCLEAVAHANDIFYIGVNSVVSGIGFLSAGERIDGDSAVIGLDCESSNEILGGVFGGEKVKGVPLREMPGDQVFDYYYDRGTWIDINDLPKSGSTRKLGKLVLGPKNNPFGEANPWGIYVIDCEGEAIEIAFIRMSGTLVLLNLGAKCEVQGPVLLEAVAPNQPTLLVDGSVTVGTRYPGNSLSLVEWHEATNYNPPGLPYEGVSDEEIDDASYPSRITGGIYATGHVIIAEDCEYEGFIVADDISIWDDKILSATYHPYALNYPPVGFSAGQGVRLIPGSRRRVEY